MFELFETIDKLVRIYTLDRFIQVVRNVAKNMGRLKSKKINVILLITMLILLVPTTSSRSIHQINEIDIFPQGDFNDSTKWMIETQSGFSNLEAQNTDAMIGTYWYDPVEFMKKIDWANFIAKVCAQWVKHESGKELKDFKIIKKQN